MGRPKGAQNKGMRHKFTRMTKELLMATKNPLTNVEQLSAATASYRKLLTKAIKTASHDDAATLQKLGAGLAALTKAVSTVDKLQIADSKDDDMYQLDFDVMGNIIGRRRK